MFTYPDALFGLEWLVALANGATVYSLEAPFHGFASLEIRERTPAFDKVLLPLIRRILGDRLIPSRIIFFAALPYSRLASPACPAYHFSLE